MLVNDRKEIRYLEMPPQFQALRIQIKQLYRVISSVCIVKPFHICSRGCRILILVSHKIRYALPMKRGKAI